MTQTTNMKWKTDRDPIPTLSYNGWLAFATKSLNAKHTEEEN
jgi:hypothetical protein